MKTKTIFEEKFEELLKKEAKGFDIDWQLVDIVKCHRLFRPKISKVKRRFAVEIL